MMNQKGHKQFSKMYILVSTGLLKLNGSLKSMNKFLSAVILATNDHSDGERYSNEKHLSEHHYRQM